MRRRKVARYEHRGPRAQQVRFRTWRRMDPAVLVRGTCESLDCGCRVFVFAIDRPRILVALSLLDGGAGRRRANRSLLASLGWTHFHRLGIRDVHALER